jgi:hypothetical protein
VQLVGRLPEVAGPGHRGEVSQVTQLHVLSVRSQVIRDDRHVRR